MEIELNGKSYQVNITYKNNKNMYLRIKDDLTIQITAPKNIPISRITKFVETNINYINKTLHQKEEKKLKKQNKFEYLGTLYDICYTNKKDIELGSTRAFIGKNANIDNWYRKKAKEVFPQIYNHCYDNFEKTRFKPELKIRKMKGKWGVCNITSRTITINLELIKYKPKYLEYVIYHELCHLKHPNHSSNFWNEVEKYVPNYKQIKKEMKNI